MDLERMMMEMGQAAKKAARVLAAVPTQPKNRALIQAAAGLRRDSGVLLTANRQDVETGQKNGLSAAMLDRLTLTEPRIDAIAKGLELIADLPDPVGETLAMWRRPNGLEIGQVRVPLGVIGVIYESRPNVTADAAGLCLKAGNAVLLRGGSEALDSNTAITQVLARAVEKTGLPAEAVQVLDTADRAAVMSMLTLDRYIDLIIPR